MVWPGGRRRKMAWPGGCSAAAPPTALAGRYGRGFPGPSPGTGASPAAAPGHRAPARRAPRWAGRPPGHGRPRCPPYRAAPPGPAAGADFGLSGQETQPGRPGIPGIDDGRAGDEVVQGTVLVLHQDAEEAQAEQQEAERERQRAEHALAGGDLGAVGPDHPQAKHVHAEGPAGHRPGIAEVAELPGHEQHGDQRVGPGPGHLVAGHHLDDEGDPGQGQGEHGGAGREVDGVGQEPGHRAGVVALRADRAFGGGWDVMARPGPCAAPGARPAMAACAGSAALPSGR